MRRALLFGFLLCLLPGCGKKEKKKPKVLHPTLQMAEKLKKDVMRQKKQAAQRNKDLEQIIDRR